MNFELQIYEKKSGEKFCKSFHRSRFKDFAGFPLPPAKSKPIYEKHTLKHLPSYHKIDKIFFKSKNILDEFSAKIHAIADQFSFYSKKRGEKKILEKLNHSRQSGKNQKHLLSFIT